MVDKETGRELVALWKGSDEIGGLLDDRQRFTSTRYTASREIHGEETWLRLTAVDSTGLRLEKSLGLRSDEREQLHALVSKGNATAYRRRHAQVLLRADQGEHGAGWNDAEIARALDVHA
ncbi:MAG: hypothetical protein WDA75_13105 [Candidatus Latescibacterota bacterium]